MTTLPHGWSERFIEGNGARLHVVEAGSGPLLLLVHGFPEFWYGWREQIGPLAEAGYHVVAPDLRGFNLSDKPSGLDAYRIGVIASDLKTLIDALSPDAKIFLVGHDWGGLLAWVVALANPERIERLVVLNTPHPTALRAAARRPSQMLRFWYQYFFQLPWIPERMLSASEYRVLRGSLKKNAVRRAAFSREVLNHYVTAWKQPGALRAMLNYYRALFRRNPAIPRGPAKVFTDPVLLIWGQKDPFFMAKAFEESRRWASDLRIEPIADAGHFVQSDEPERVNQLILEFFAESDHE